MGGSANIDGLVADFPGYLEAFERSGRVSASDQRENHRRVLRLLGSFGSVREALADEVFCLSLWAALASWDLIGLNARLVGLETFMLRVRAAATAIDELTGLRLGEPEDSVLVAHLRPLLFNLAITQRRGDVRVATPLVSGSKCLHHLLPNLVVPIDRRYTVPFLGQRSYFQADPIRCLAEAQTAFTTIARAVDLERYVNPERWHTTPTKVVDNAIVGFCVSQGLVPARRLA